MVSINKLKAKLLALTVRRVYDYIIQSPEYDVSDVLYFAENMNDHKDLFERVLNEVQLETINDLIQECKDLEMRLEITEGQTA